MIASPQPRSLTTARLVLRPSAAADAARAFAIQSNWNVTRMLRMASFPPDRAEIEAWFADHPRQWRNGEAYRFAVECRGERPREDGSRMIGLVDLDEIAEGGADLGYWFEEAAWGQGYAAEAAEAVVRFAFSMLGLARLRSGHAEDNATSGRVLAKLGFIPIDQVPLASRARGTEIRQARYVLERLYV